MSSTQVPTTSGKSKSNTAVTHQDDETVVHPETSRKKGKKKKDDPSKGTEPLPDNGKSARRDISPSSETQVKRVRKRSKKVSPKPATGR
jgi:hypothetical protein